ncbi:MAG: response regulator transcription factor [Acidobacteriota bacterium]|nr:response regulator transcription factor [Acidobacteriota bacterium]
MTPIRVLVADDHTIVRQGLVSLLLAGGDCRIIAEAADGQEAFEKALELVPDVVVMDLSMPRLSGLEAVRRIHKESPRIRILVLTMHKEEEFVLPVVRAGASGYLVKDAAASELLNAVRKLARGEVYFDPHAAKALAEVYRSPKPGEEGLDSLTAREREVLHLVTEGRSTKEIAGLLDISPKTAENHRTRVMQKLGVHNTAELVRYAAQRGLLF